ncbi:MAG: tetratricopeptide repeat protein, partial [Anaerolineae bacterium]|nr:tetratricopeptide repeat protein [Anaerolineae bacterium]
QTAFEAALEKDAENAAAHRGLGWVQYEVGQYEEAVAQFSKAVELEPANPDGYEGQGRSLYALARYEDALAVSKLWEEVEPDDVQKESLVCQASYQLGYYEEAVSSCKNWAAKEPQNALAHVSLGWAHLEAKRNQEAIQSFSRSLELAETDDGFLGLCEALSSLGDQKGVVASAQRWIAYNPRNADAHIYLGWASYQLKDYPEAVEAFSSSLAIEENSEAHHGLGDSFYAQKDYDSALKSYEKWLVLEPENALAYALLGWVQYSMNNTEDALRSFARALEMGPIASAYRGLGSVYYAQAEYELALENQEQWVDLEPNSAAARGSLGWTLQKLKRHADAASSFQRAVELFPTTDYYSGLWTSLRAIPDAQKALSAAEQWTEFDSDDARPFAALGWTYVDLNDCANARSNFQKALELDPQSESAKSGLDRCP